ncbi:hypothetical protein MIND_00830300 [Mycena indigotica]|uniref:Uncharacterized protein n=1 Tax=Mycena indigotica TaxID=2126181 RepID=A0A8H6SI85_9AGAR|nr:uncharacterized protein MIND_00830300 [Mycena indigotica]KAF7298827.1 hypothetical protein MIND_00830300 [Mycena indigotica]
MPKRRLSLHSIFSPEGSASASKHPKSSPYSHNTQHDAASVNSLVDSDTESFLLDEDPFADLSAGPELQPLSNAPESTSASTIKQRATGSHPSLSTLVRKNIAAPHIPHGHVGANLPAEPWDIAPAPERPLTIRSISAPTSSLQSRPEILQSRSLPKLFGDQEICYDRSRPSKPLPIQTRRFPSPRYEYQHPMQSMSADPVMPLVPPTINPFPILPEVVPSEPLSLLLSQTLPVNSDQSEGEDELELHRLGIGFECRQTFEPALARNASKKLKLSPIVLPCHKRGHRRTNAFPQLDISLPSVHPDVETSPGSTTCFDQEWPTASLMCDTSTTCSPPSSWSGHENDSSISDDVHLPSITKSRSDCGHDFTGSPRRIVSRKPSYELGKAPARQRSRLRDLVWRRKTPNGEPQVPLVRRLFSGPT